MSESELDINSIISGLMSDPKAVEMISSLKASMGANAPKNREEPIQGIPSDVLDKLPELMSTLAPIMGGENHNAGGNNKTTDNRNRLLEALKPYLNSNRQEIIDNVMRISRLSGIASMLQNKK